MFLALTWNSPIFTSPGEEITLLDQRWIMPGAFRKPNDIAKRHRAADADHDVCLLALEASFPEPAHHCLRPVCAKDEQPIGLEAREARLARPNFLLAEHGGDLSPHALESFFDGLCMVNLFHDDN